MPSIGESHRPPHKDQQIRIFMVKHCRHKSHFLMCRSLSLLRCCPTLLSDFKQSKGLSLHLGMVGWGGASLCITDYRSVMPYMVGQASENLFLGSLECIKQHTLNPTSCVTKQRKEQEDLLQNVAMGLCKYVSEAKISQDLELPCHA